MWLSIIFILEQLVLYWLNLQLLVDQCHYRFNVRSNTAYTSASFTGRWRIPSAILYVTFRPFKAKNVKFCFYHIMVSSWLLYFHVEAYQYVPQDLFSFLHVEEHTMENFRKRLKFYSTFWGCLEVLVYWGTCMIFWLMYKKKQ